MEVDCEIDRIGGSILGFLSQPHFNNLNKSFFLEKSLIEIIQNNCFSLYLTLLAENILHGSLSEGQRSVLLTSY